MQAAPVIPDDGRAGLTLDRAREALWGWRSHFAWAAGAVALWVVLDHVLSKGLPIGIVLLGVVYGSIYALLAMGIVLVYRGNRIINFAQAQMGVIAAILAIELNVTYGVNFGALVPDRHRRGDRDRGHPEPVAAALPAELAARS